MYEGLYTSEEEIDYESIEEVWTEIRELFTFSHPTHASDGLEECSENEWYPCGGAAIGNYEEYDPVPVYLNLPPENPIQIFPASPITGLGMSEPLLKENRYYYILMSIWEADSGQQIQQAAQELFDIWATLFHTKFPPENDDGTGVDWPPRDDPDAARKVPWWYVFAFDLSGFSILFLSGLLTLINLITGAMDDYVDTIALLVSREALENVERIGNLPTPYQFSIKVSNEDTELDWILYFDAESMKFFNR